MFCHISSPTPLLKSQNDFGRGEVWSEMLAIKFCREHSLAEEALFLRKAPRALVVFFRRIDEMKRLLARLAHDVSMPQRRAVDQDHARRYA